MSILSHFGNFVLVVLGDKVTKKLRNTLLIFHFVLPILPCKGKTLYIKSGNLSDEKPKNEATKICDEPVILFLDSNEGPEKLS